MDFDTDFESLTGHPPFPWQRRLFDKWFARGRLPSAVDIPTGLGKTAVMAVWLLACARQANLPRRLAYVVDRRAVVDQATDYAERLRCALKKASLEHVQRGLRPGGRLPISTPRGQFADAWRVMIVSSPIVSPISTPRGQFADASKTAPDGSKWKLPISTLRGQFADNREWMDDPAAPAIIVGTVDMIGSRLLFEGYGLSRRMRPYAAGLLGCDTLALLDEAHLCRPFERMLRAIEKNRAVKDGTNGAATRIGCFAGPAATSTVPPPFRVLPLSATPGVDSTCGRPRLRIGGDDRAHETVRARLDAVKTLSVENLEKEEKLDEALAERAIRLMRDKIDETGKPVRIVIYCDRRGDAEKTADILRKSAKREALDAETILFVGGRRAHEREDAARRLKKVGLIPGHDAPESVSVFLVATSAGEVGVDLDADHMVGDLVAWERMTQRLGRVNRRGLGKARVLVIDRGPPDEKQAGKEAVERHRAARKLLDRLPRDEAGGRQAGPAALTRLGDDPELRQLVEKASSPMPLYPALSRPVVESWAMTSLADHTGRPEVSPWLRGWVNEEAQTSVIWRRFLPVRFEGDGSHSRFRVPPKREIEEFFDVAPPRTDESLEAETWRVAEWLKKRVRNYQKTLGRERNRNDDPAADDNEQKPNPTPDDLLQPIRSETPIAFVFGNGGGFERTYSMDNIGKLKPDDLKRDLPGRRLIVDARLNGIDEGLLDPRRDGRAATVEDGWGRLTDNQRESARGETGESASSENSWQEILSFPYLVSAEGETKTWIVVEKRHSGEGDSDARSITPKSQRLDEHQSWVADEAARIARELGLRTADAAMLVAAAGAHDEGKRAARWQRAFNAGREGGSYHYAKTRGPVNRHVLNGYRHEFQSAFRAERNGLDDVPRDDSPRFALALHLIAAHHGNARPSIGIEGCDALPPTAAAREARKIALRFARLQRQWGPWGLAWWEALLRAADQRASRRLDAESSTARAPFGQSDLFAVRAEEAG